jgi:D-beta-D-heptose 7-phosphate kinase / D-beta-D-heptose 1-phosphate adenosyltransferase
MPSLIPDSLPDLLPWLDRWSSLSMLVIGDAILDSYIEGHAERLCREAPAPVVTVEQQQDMAGGAANTAANLASLGSKVSLLSVIGVDPAGQRLQQTLTQLGVSTSTLICSPERMTLSKQRILADQQILARLDQGSTTSLSCDLEQALIDQLTQQYLLHDGVVISDYSYGILTPRLIQTLAELQACSPRPVIIDSRRLSAYCSIQATAVKPNYDEALQLLHLPRQTEARAAQIAPYADRLLAITGAELVVVTLDSEGAIGFTAQQSPFCTHVTSVPPNRTSGAGDTFTSALSLSLAAGAPASEAISLATTATAVAVQRPETIRTTLCSAAALRQTLSVDAVPDLIHATAAPADPALQKLILSPAELSDQIQRYRTSECRIVFTNGCFDILHPGHVTYLQQAKALGDLLIVGVNSDDSVRRLKGETRPVNGLADRLTVLAALSCIDHLVPFSELNPNNLIRVICPDLFVKGGDYSRSDLPEVDLVEELGGEVRILPYVQNRSTTGLIAQIRLSQS